MRDFAQELVDLVIDHVAATTNRGDIGSCGCVCRRWLPRSRMHLFSRITLSTSHRDAVQVLMDLIDASCSDILSLVRTLHIRITRGTSDSHMARLRSCAQLRELHIHEFYAQDQHEFDRIVLTHVPRFGASCPSLTRFEFIPQGDLHLYVLADILSGLPCLTHLQLSGPVFTAVARGVSNPMTALPVATLPPNWHALDFSLQGANLLFQWLLSHREPPIFASLRLAGWADRREHIEPIRSYLRRFGSRIESLSLAYLADGFCVCTNVERSAFEAYTMASSPRLVELNLAGQSSEAIPTILSSISSVRLTTLKIEVLRGRPLDWLLIDTVLATPKFATLRHVSFTQYSESGLESLFTPEVKTMMPQTTARNLFL
ncbi:hypothetical protein C8R45DRAFT_1215025 [Mycena sanguinolenta]|nr:hypothetical protein C8R45DRAFT_1215025 [Mycena sanguinolenta]